VWIAVHKATRGEAAIAKDCADEEAPSKCTVGEIEVCYRGLLKADIEEGDAPDSESPRGVPTAQQARSSRNPERASSAERCMPAC